MDIRHRFSENSWPLVESWIQESIEEFTRRRLQPLEGNSVQHPDSPGNRTSSFARETRVQPSTLSVQGWAFTPSQHLPDFNLGNEQQSNRVQHSGRGNETIDSAYFTTFNPTNASSHTRMGLLEDEQVAIDDFVNTEATLLSPGQMFQPSDDNFFDFLANPSGAQEHPDPIDLSLGGVVTQRRSQHRQNRY